MWYIRETEQTPHLGDSDFVSGWICLPSGTMPGSRKGRSLLNKMEDLHIHGTDGIIKRNYTEGHAWRWRQAQPHGRRKMTLKIRLRLDGYGWRIIAVATPITICKLEALDVVQIKVQERTFEKGLAEDCSEGWTILLSSFETTESSRSYAGMWQESHGW